MPTHAYTCLPMLYPTHTLPMPTNALLLQHHQRRDSDTPMGQRPSELIIRCVCACVVRTLLATGLLPRKALESVSECQRT